MKNKNKICRVGIAVLFISLLFKAEYSSAKQNFIIGVQNIKEYLPYSEYKDGKYGGFNRELLDLFADSKRYAFVYEARPVKRLYREYLDGEFDLKYPDNPYWSANLKKGKDIKYSDPIVEYIDGVLVLPENKGKGVKHLKKLGMVAGFTPFAYLKLINAGAIKISENTNYAGLLKQTILKRVDGAYSNITVSQYYLKKVLTNRNALVFDADLPHTRSHRHLSSFKYPKIIDEFNDFLKRHSAAIEKLKMKYRVEGGISAY